MAIDPHDQAAYDALQARLVPLWTSLARLNTDEQTIVVVPNADVDVELSPSELQAYEERFLFLLLLLRQPRARMVYVTGQTINPDIVDYYLDLMPGVMASHVRRRLVLLSPMEATFRPLSRKVLERPRLIEAIRSHVADPSRAHLISFMTTWDDRELAMRLDIPLYGADPKDAYLGTKSMGRELFAEAGVAHPVGREHLRSRGDVMRAITGLRRSHADLTAVVVKHNEGVSGFGNAVLDLSTVPPSGRAGEDSAVEALLDGIHTGMPGVGSRAFFDTLAREGGVVEAMVTGVEIRSPSVQLRITPLGAMEVLSTHDQVLGGESGQVFMGSRFPADPAYASLISDQAAAVGARLAERGVIGRFALDFVVARQPEGRWQSYAIEINLRKGGTTHPFLTLQFLTDGTYDASTGTFTAPSGRAKYYVSSDHVDDPALRTLTPRDVLDLAVLHGLHFDQSRQTGSVFFMLSTLPGHGRLGVLSVGDSPEDAKAHFDRTVERILVEARSP